LQTHPFGTNELETEAGFRSPEKGEDQAEKEKIGSSNEALLLENSIDGM